MMQRFQMPIISLLQPSISISGTENLISGIKELDNLFGELKGGEFIVLHGSQMCHVISELLCVRNQLPKVEGGLDSSAIFIDGGNIFDPYFISETARILGLNPEETLRNIWISRAFTSYQIVALITERLRPFLDQNKSKLAVISDITSLFCDSDTGILEAMKTFNRITLFLWNLVRETQIALAVTSLSSQSKKKQRLEQYLLGRADVTARIDEGNPHMKISLEKHPSRPLMSLELSFREPSIQSLL